MILSRPQNSAVSLFSLVLTPRASMPFVPGTLAFRRLKPDAPSDDPNALWAVPPPDPKAGDPEAPAVPEKLLEGAEGLRRGEISALGPGNRDFSWVFHGFYAGLLAFSWV